MKQETKAALLASWVQQSSFEPPRISIAVHKERPMNALLTDQTLFALHILSADQKEWLGRFAKPAKDEKAIFAGISVRQGLGGAPIFEEAWAYLECRVCGRYDAGDHHLILADVMNGAVQRDGEPRIHLRRSGLSY
jgi:flavin reductase (DIM6/NTAB) family NADH-FMN oxidoreductase RutF